MTRKRSAVFFDIHCHAMNLTHPSFLAFIENLGKSHTSSILKEALTLGDMLPTHSLSGTRSHLLNLLTVMESGIGAMFLLMEDDLAGRFRTSGDQPFIRDEKLHVGGDDYDRLVLTPLIMDFKTPGVQTNDIYYSQPPEKSLRKQIRDMLEGIRYYVQKRPDGMLEIYPFLGLNPLNYQLEEIQKLLHEFLGLSSIPRKLFYKTFVALRQVDIATPISGRGLFAGVKLYPPLGFDPWPEGDPDAFVKVNYVYEFCQKRGIPITTHCDDQGFRTISLEQSLEWTSPARWRAVLSHYPQLKLNFAHFGRQYLKKFGVIREMTWFHEIIDLCCRYDNVYTDFSFTGVRPDFYSFLAKTLAEMNVKKRVTLQRKIMFGSDFMINLLDIQSYYDYYKLFDESELSAEQKRTFGSENPARFIFQR